MFFRFSMHVYSETYFNSHFQVPISQKPKATAKMCEMNQIGTMITKSIFKSREILGSLFPQFRGGGRRISSSAFLSRCPFGYYLPRASYGTMFAAKRSSNGLEAVVSKRLAQGHKGLTAHRCFFRSAFLFQMLYFLL